jgi:hypothetical protein
MTKLIANPTEDGDLHRPKVCLSSPDDFESGHHAGSVPGSASKYALVSLRTNVHQNVHQRIKKDRIGYVRIRPDFGCKYLQIRELYSDSDSRLQSEPLLPQEFTEGEG